MKGPVHISQAISDLFGGFPPTTQTIKKAQRFRNKHLPAVGACRTESSLAIQVYREISRQISRGIIKPAEVCRVCPRWDCPVRKGTVSFQPF